MTDRNAAPERLEEAAGGQLSGIIIATDDFGRLCRMLSKRTSID